MGVTKFSKDFFDEKDSRTSSPPVPRRIESVGRVTAMCACVCTPGHTKANVYLALIRGAPGQVWHVVGSGPPVW